MYDFQANPHSKRENAPPGSHLNNLLSNLFILQKEGSRLSQEDLRADVSLLESPFNPETSGRKPNSFKSQVNFSPSLSLVPFTLGIKTLLPLGCCEGQNNMCEVITHSLAPRKLLRSGGCYWIDMTMNKEHLAPPGTQQALCIWQLIHSTVFLVVSPLLCSKPSVITPFCPLIFPFPVAQVLLEWSLHTLLFKAPTMCQAFYT